jgi:hypothetical protein
MFFRTTWPLSMKVNVQIIIWLRKYKNTNVFLCQPYLIQRAGNVRKAKFTTWSELIVQLYMAAGFLTKYKFKFVGVLAAKGMMVSQYGIKVLLASIEGKSLENFLLNNLHSV